jgi:hypothetical protein
LLEDHPQSAKTSLLNLCFPASASHAARIESNSRLSKIQSLWGTLGEGTQATSQPRGPEVPAMAPESQVAAHSSLCQVGKTRARFPGRLRGENQKSEAGGDAGLLPSAWVKATGCPRAPSQGFPTCRAHRAPPTSPSNPRLCSSAGALRGRRAGWGWGRGEVNGAQ